MIHRYNITILMNYVQSQNHNYLEDWLTRQGEAVGARDPGHREGVRVIHRQHSIKWDVSECFHHSEGGAFVLHTHTHTQRSTTSVCTEILLITCTKIQTTLSNITISLTDLEIHVHSDRDIKKLFSILGSQLMAR